MSPDAWVDDAVDLREHIPDPDETGVWELLPAREDISQDTVPDPSLIGQSSYLLRWTHPHEPVYVTVKEQTQYMDPQVWYWGLVSVYSPGFTVGINKKDGDLQTVLEWATAWMRSTEDPSYLVDDPEYANRYTSGDRDPGHDYA